MATVQQPPQIPGLAYRGFLGAGGFSDVYLYESASPARHVAVKVLREKAVSGAVMARFITEVNTMAVLEHPNIARVYTCGVTADGRPYIEMAYYPGQTLAQAVRKGPLPVSEVLRIGVQLASAIEAAHSVGLLHRDIKPANVLMDKFGDPILTDFGVAAHWREMDEAESSVSVPWAPPEAVFGTAPLDQRCDIYSLAATMWHLLAGHSPFEAPGGDNTSRAVMVRVRDMPVPPTGRGDVPQSLELLLRQSMSKDPRLRPVSAESFARSLNAIEEQLRLRPTPFKVVRAGSGAPGVPGPTGPGPNLGGPALMAMPASDATVVRSPGVGVTLLRSTIPPVEAPAPKNKRRGLLVVMVCVICFVVVAAGAGTWILLKPTPNPPVEQTSDATYSGPAPEKVLDAYPVVEAIDVPDQPTFGQPWNAYDRDDPSEQLIGFSAVPPCGGVFVTVLTSDYRAKDVDWGAASRIIGYDILSGAQSWSLGLRELTGQTDPHVTDVSYTSDCWMVLNTFDGTGQVMDASNAVNLLTGASVPLDSDSLGGCEAAGEGWAGCWDAGADGTTKAVSLNGDSPGWEEPTDLTDPASASLVNHVDFVVAGKVWTPEGYRDPASDDVAFGSSDSALVTRVRYAEAARPGGYQSGVVVRMTGDLTSDEATCAFTVWDTGAGAGKWATPGSMPCGRGYEHTWVATTQALIVVSDPVGGSGGPPPVIRAYALSNGQFLWERDGSPYATHMDASTIGAVDGFSDTTVFIQDPETQDVDIVRISDGARIKQPDSYLLACSPTMIYEILSLNPGTDQHQFFLAAYTIDQAHPDADPVEAWRLPVDAPADSTTLYSWTFAVGGTMYFVHSTTTRDPQVTPLLG